ncbi:hypothetical protein J6590_013187 [Homalodisca vitripennis]|nr:hypothetical protein J6590_013187 [Homalodisca vitripennis]
MLRQTGTPSNREELESSTKEVPLDSNKELTLEMGVIKIVSKKKQLYIVGVYRIPAGQLEEALNLLSAAIEETKAENHSILIMGDKMLMA